jgi:hypothetical protein
MHHFDPVNALEMPSVKSIDRPDLGSLGKGDDPCVYEIDRVSAVDRNGIGNDRFLADLDPPAYAE